MPRVVIVGAGPAGAALACLLARRGIDVTLLERHTDFAREFRGEGLMPSGADALAQMGLGAALDALPQTRIVAVEIFRAGRRLGRITMAELGGPGPRMVSQPALLEMLVAEASRSPTFHIERGTTVRDLLHENGRVTGVHAESPAGAGDFHADLVIGTDGRASVVRTRAGLHETRSPQIFDLVWCKVPLPESFAGRDTFRVYLGHHAFALAFPAPDGRLQIGWIIEKGSFGDLRRQGIDAWVATMADQVSPDLAAHLRAHRDQITHPFLLDVVCDRLVRWTAPGLLLLGDAAHPMSPVGAQGINIALRDALVAANHLGPVLGGGAGPAEVDAAARRVVEERLPEVAEIQGLQQGPPDVLFGRTWWSGLVLDYVLPFVVRSGLVRRFARPVFQRFANGVTTVRLER